jgi:uncharacterized protein (DUF433 family)
MRNFDAISVHPEVQDGAPVFSGTRIRIETFFDYMRIGVSMSEFLDEFPSITPDQAREVYELATQHYTPDQIGAMISGPTDMQIQPGEGRFFAAA